MMMCREEIKLSFFNTNDTKIVDYLTHSSSLHGLVIDMNTIIE